MNAMLTALGTVLGAAVVVVVVYLLLLGVLLAASEPLGG